MGGRLEPSEALGGRLVAPEACLEAEAVVTEVSDARTSLTAILFGGFLGAFGGAVAGEYLRAFGLTPRQVFTDEKKWFAVLLLQRDAT